MLAAPRAGQANVPPALRWLLGGGDLGPPSWPGPCRAALEAPGPRLHQLFLHS